MTRLRVIGKNIHLNIGEKEWLGVMMRQFGCTEQVALEEIIVYKREMAHNHGRQGNVELERHLLMEIDEWDDSREEDYKQIASKVKDITIVFP